MATGGAQIHPSPLPMKSMEILYLGNRSGTSLDRANALRRLGHQVEHIDLRDLLPQSIWIDRLTWRMGGQWFAPLVGSRLGPLLLGRRFDLCHVDGGEWVTPRVVELLRRHASRVINYNIDDPLGGRDRARFVAYRRSLPLYDLCVVMRAQNVREARSCGARAVTRVYMSADERTHAPRVLTAADHARWDSDVLFIGTWFPERGRLLRELSSRGVPITIHGAHWHKAPEWNELQRHWRSGPIHGDEYAKAIQCAKVNLGLLSKANRDLHTTRSLEIPALGGLLCAERTSEHLAMYTDNREALFWSDLDECAAKCRLALSDPQLRHDIALQGQARALTNGFYNEKVMQSILEVALRS